MTMQVRDNELVQNNHELENIRLSDAVFDVVTFFYPRSEYLYLVQLYIRPDDIANIMNCSWDEAAELYRDIRRSFGDESFRVLIPHFCEYTGVDELFVHLFLVSLKEPDDISADPFLVILPTGPRLSCYQNVSFSPMIESYEDNLFLDSISLEQRTKVYHIKNPLGEPMYCKAGNFRTVIYADEVSAILRIHIRTAQKMLQDIRNEHNMKRKLPVSIKKFCIYYPLYEEDELRHALDIMYKDDKDGDNGSHLI